MTARIYRPARSAMSSGIAKTRMWILEFVNETGRDIDPLMGWTSSDDTSAQVRMTFPTKEAALDYAKDHGIDAVVIEPKPRRPNVRPRGYGENFATDRRNGWTH
ncbi:ETC complex I subunit [Silicimonas algicola]|uniref:ETC complex I subunit-like protein n=1 Tax=Silicimonas algicola TaxID=1826607 RepID=A0A316G567_9RHOB|nr:ETC complex I subunit [Silicimonas algicola]AZQ68825.1 ETC complex I subunit [Silicimonas algicola]PWK56091.1 ETC complex I subunit-like protein [Silicimonas algicola]